MSASHPTPTTTLRHRPISHHPKAANSDDGGAEGKENNGVNVRVIVRIRPLLDAERKDHSDYTAVHGGKDHREVVVSQAAVGRKLEVYNKTFTFDGVCGQFASQIELFDNHITPIVDEVLLGFNCTIFAYGQTGTGKTYTMEGDPASISNKTGLTETAGIIPRSIQRVFECLESQHNEYSVRVSYLEIYNEELNDLLNEGERQNLRLFDDSTTKKGLSVDKLEEVPVNNPQDIYNILRVAVKKRRTAETLLNRVSSRSHCIFSITIHMKETNLEGEDVIKIGKLNLVDLAGSENVQRSGTNTVKDRAKEAGMINQSLLTLGRVINALVEHTSYVPYRDSKLTRLLQESLGGRTKTCIVATVSPSSLCLEETLSTLDYAHRAKNIRNRPEINQRTSQRVMIRDLTNEIQKLKNELSAAREKNGVYLPLDRYNEMESRMCNQGTELKDLENEIKKKRDEFDQMKAMCEETKKALKAAEAEIVLDRVNLERSNRSLIEAHKKIESSDDALRKTGKLAKKLRSAEESMHKTATEHSVVLRAAVNTLGQLWKGISRLDAIMLKDRETITSVTDTLAECATSIASAAEALHSGQVELVESLSQCSGRHDKEFQTSCTSLKDELASLRQKCSMGHDTLKAKFAELSTETCSKHVESFRGSILSEIQRKSSIIQDEGEGLNTAITNWTAEWSLANTKLSEFITSAQESLSHKLDNCERSIAESNERLKVFETTLTKEMEGQIARNTALKNQLTTAKDVTASHLSQKVEDMKTKLQSAFDMMVAELTAEMSTSQNVLVATLEESDQAMKTAAEDRKAKLFVLSSDYSGMKNDLQVVKKSLTSDMTTLQESTHQTENRVKEIGAEARSVSAALLATVGANQSAIGDSISSGMTELSNAITCAVDEIQEFSGQNYSDLSDAVMRSTTMVDYTVQEMYSKHRSEERGQVDNFLKKLKGLAEPNANARQGIEGCITVLNESFKSDERSAPCDPVDPVDKEMWTNFKEPTIPELTKPEALAPLDRDFDEIPIKLSMPEFATLSTAIEEPSTANDATSCDAMPCRDRIAINAGEEGVAAGVPTCHEDSSFATKTSRPHRAGSCPSPATSVALSAPMPNSGNTSRREGSPIEEASEKLPAPQGLKKPKTSTMLRNRSCSPARGSVEVADIGSPCGIPPTRLRSQRLRNKKRSPTTDGDLVGDTRKHKKTEKAAEKNSEL